LEDYVLRRETWELSIPLSSRFIGFHAAYSCCLPSKLLGASFPYMSCPDAVSRQHDTQQYLITDRFIETVRCIISGEEILGSL
jgi:hypothetical protein